MARKNQTQEAVEQVAVEQAPQTMEQPKVEFAPIEPRPKTNWKEASNDQKLEIYYASVRANVGKAVKTAQEKGDKPFWEKETPIKDIENSMPFDASNGNVFNNEQLLNFKSYAQAKGFENDPQFITINEALKIARATGDRFEMPDMKENQGVKTIYFKNFEYVPKYNEQGQAIQATNQFGKPLFKQDGTPLQAYEQKPLPSPVAETATYYHISELKGFATEKNMAMLKPRNLEAVHRYQEKIQANPGYDIRPNLDRLKLFGETARQMSEFLKSVKMGKDFTPLQKTQSQEQGR